MHEILFYFIITVENVKNDIQYMEKLCIVTRILSVHKHINVYIITNIVSLGFRCSKKLHASLMQFKITEFEETILIKNAYTIAL